MEVGQLKISVIMPMFNVDEYIVDTINSVLSQTLTEFEFIIIDDNSTDRSYEIASAYAQSDARIILSKHSSKGASSIRNLGMEKAQGKYILFLDADDILAPKGLEILYGCAVDQEADLIVGHHEMFMNDYKEIPWIFKEFKSLNIPGEKSLLKDKELLQLPYCWGKLYSKSLLDKISFPEEIVFGEDQVFITEAYLRAQKIFLTDSIVYSYRKREGQITQSGYLLPDRYLRDIISVFEKVQDQMRTSIDKKEDAENLYIYYLHHYLRRNLLSNLANGLLSDDLPLQLAVMKNYKEWLQTLEINVCIGIKKQLEFINLSIEKMLPVFSVEAIAAYEDLSNTLQLLEKQKGNGHKTPLITIQTTAYNVEKYIRECADSILNQTFENFEWVVVDNGSTDSTGDILREYAIKDSRIKLFKNEKNTIIHKAEMNSEYVNYLLNLRSEYWCMLDSDDTIHPDFLNELYTLAKTCDADIAMAGSQKVYEENNRPNDLRPCPNFEVQQISQLGELFPDIYFLLSVQWGKLVKVSVLEKQRAYRTKNLERVLRHANDTMFTLDLLKFSNSVVGINRILHNYRIRSNSYYHSQIDKHRYLDYLFIYEESEKLLNGWGGINERTTKFLAVTLMNSLLVCIRVYVDSKVVSLKDKLEGIQELLANKDILTIADGEALGPVFVAEALENLKTIAMQVEKENLPTAIVHYIYRLVESIRIVNSNAENKISALLLFLSSVCDNKNNNKIGSIFLYPFLTMFCNRHYKSLEDAGVTAEFLSSDNDLLRELVNGNVERAIEICLNYSHKSEYSNVMKVLTQISFDQNRDSINKEVEFLALASPNISDNELAEVIIRILTVSPLNKDALIHKLILMHRLGDFITALETAEVLRVFYPKDNKVLLLIAQFYSAIGLIEQSESLRIVGHSDLE
ncbi:glycosyltransferase family 2 protein [Paenibacillus massiliensis]|uniref:glycosyltransferase family 2 protein n=1 Tax=Paenibacillus massiliensis TaxID=225917 RepID=UPI000366C38A|nr:glycosyltransferase [Paenibacillus massiliensis]